MKEMFRAMRERLARNEPLVLVTLIESSGSTPREAGARMLVDRDGRCWGTIGGALPEHLAIEQARSLVERRGGACVKKYILRENEAADLGAKCGGEMTVFFHYCDGSIPGLADFIEAALQRFAVNDGTSLLMDVTEGGETLSLALASSNGIAAALGSPPLAVPPPRNTCALFEQDGRRWFSAPLAEAGFVCVFGGGHVAGELVPLLCRLDFRCVVFDDRGDFARPDLFPTAGRVICGDFSRIGDHLSLGENDSAVIITRGHLWDYEAEAFALRSPAAYIGVIGSRSKHAFIREKLLAAGFTAADLDAPRVHAPIGIDIGSKTPAEVAVSIAAELVHERRRR